MISRYDSSRKSRGVRPSRMHGSACVCGDWKKTWQVTCERCWISLPAELRSRIWRLFKDKATRGTSQHLAAVAEAHALLRKPKESGK